MRVAILIAILILVSYELAFSPVSSLSVYTETTDEKLFKERPKKFIFYYAHAGFSNQLYALQR
jgi:hypothetical protein